MTFLVLGDACVRFLGEAWTNSANSQCDRCYGRHACLLQGGEVVDSSFVATDFSPTPLKEDKMEVRKRPHSQASWWYRRKCVEKLWWFWKKEDFLLRCFSGRISIFKTDVVPCTLDFTAYGSLWSQFGGRCLHLRTQAMKRLNMVRWGRYCWHSKHKKRMEWL